MSQWVTYQAQKALEDLQQNFTDFNASEWKFVYADERFDEALVHTIGKRQYPHIWVFDKETNFTYSWDRYVRNIT